MTGDSTNEHRQTKSNVKNFNKLLVCMKDSLEFTDNQLNTIWRTLAAILNIGELKVFEDDGGEAKFEDNEFVTKSEYELIVVTKLQPIYFYKNTNKSLFF